VPGFEVRGFWPAFWGALIVSALSWVVNGFVSDPGRVVVISEPERPALRREVESGVGLLSPGPGLAVAHDPDPLGIEAESPSFRLGADRGLVEGLAREVEGAPVDGDQPSRSDVVERSGAPPPA
jgi:hypothetical protein